MCLAVNICAAFWPFGDARPITYARNQTKIEKPFVEHLPSYLLEVEVMMNATNQSSQWKCIEQIIQSTNAKNFSTLLFTMLKPTYLDQVNKCYTSSDTSQWTETAEETIRSFQPHYYIIGIIAFLGILFLCIICKLCCILCKKKSDDDELD